MKIHRNQAQPSVSPSSSEKTASMPLNCIGPTARTAKARAKGQLKGDLAYTQQKAEADLLEGWVEDDVTVRHKLKSKEEFPQG